MKKQAEEHSVSAYQNKERLSQHDIENKIGRRRQELEELEKILHDIAYDNKSIKESLAAEVKKC